tara:strand:- start:1624 stop:3309 length:1686 start_codon:yes stop_codon:yes gene_type:complete
MQLLIAHILVFIQISIASLFFSLSGFLLKYLIFKKKDFNEFYENGLFGFILIGFVSLGLNFFFPLNLLTNNIAFIIIVILAYKFDFFNQNFFKLIKNIFFVTLISYLFLIYANVNRPDGFTYHLPYSQIINDHKIIIGLSNLQFRYGHISIFQYISSFFVNSIYSKNGLLIPISLVPSFFYIYCVNKFINDFDNIKTRLNSYLVFLLFVTSVYALSRYSGWGNDGQVHIFYFLTIIYLLDLYNNKNNLNLFYKISLTSLFTFLIKPFHLITLLIPFAYFVFYKKKINLIKSRSSYFLLIFFCMWIVKNVLVSSCAIYPILITCSEKLSWFNESDIIKESLSGEAWSKDWINRENKSLDHKDYVKDFNWLKTWVNNHFKIVLEKVFPVILFLILNFLLLYFSKCLKKNSSKKKDNLFKVFFYFSLLTVFLWFIKFPLYRFGISYIYSFIILIFYFIYIKNINLNNLIKFKSFFIIIICFSFFGLFIKNVSRIYDTKNASIYPYLIKPNTTPVVKQIYDLDGNFTHYQSISGACSVSKSPCTHFDVSVTKDIFFGYQIFKNTK